VGSIAIIVLQTRSAGVPADSLLFRKYLSVVSSNLLRPLIRVSIVPESIRTSPLFSSIFTCKTSSLTPSYFPSSPNQTPPNPLLSYLLQPVQSFLHSAFIRAPLRKWIPGTPSLVVGTIPSSSLFFTRCSFSLAFLSKSVSLCDKKPPSPLNFFLLVDRAVGFL